MRTLVLGANGQLGRHLASVLPAACFWDRGDLDLEQIGRIGGEILAHRPETIVNAAAFTAVDRAEQEPSKAWTINAEAPAQIARAATALGARLIHVSTDYVFGGDGSAALRTDDATQPINVYGRSKLAGELAVSTLCSTAWVLRTSWLFSAIGQNFLRTVLRLGTERTALRIVDDQRGRPTYAGDLAAVIARLCEPGAETRIAPFGAYHATGGADASWREFASSIVHAATARGLLLPGVTVVGIPSSEYPTPARRPKNSVLAPSAELASVLDGGFDWHRGIALSLDQMARGGATGR